MEMDALVSALGRQLEKRGYAISSPLTMRSDTEGTILGMRAGQGLIVHVRRYESATEPEYVAIVERVIATGRGKIAVWGVLEINEGDSSHRACALHIPANRGAVAHLNTIIGQMLQPHR